jgi:hypothetical protein
VLFLSALGGFLGGVRRPRLPAPGRRIRDLLGLDETFSAALAGGTKAAVLERGRVAPRD